ncbi:MAG: MaoC family dehydratase [Chloroflexi bacterium]|nr:MaoC family dehydratase [Chloroflexota bacterium]
MTSNATSHGDGTPTYVADPLASQRYYEDVEVGEEFEESHHPTSPLVQEFLKTWWTSHPVGADHFSSVEEARKRGFERPIVPGPMLTGLVSRTITNWMGPLGRIISLDVSFRRTVLHDDPVQCKILVTDAADYALEAGGPGIVRLDVTMLNERDEQPVQGTAEVELPRRA